MPVGRARSSLTSSDLPHHEAVSRGLHGLATTGSSSSPPRLPALSPRPVSPELRFKQVHPTRLIFSARVGLAHRALAVRAGEDVIWFWIGSHADYDNLLGRL